MDPHETLRAGRTIKEKGNDSFKRGQLFEAQRGYTEVLAMLTEEIIFTGDDQRKEKETLVLTAHLNLAQCALRLGDNARVIYHCNVALGMDNNNVKAHFRKARAFENRAEFAEALESYRHVLTLEPHNKTVQRQLSECQKKLDRKKAEEQMAGQEDQEEDEDVEVIYEDSERDPQTRYKNCTKNPGHDNFINVNDFKIEDLPPNYRDQELFDYIKNHQSQITVLLKVWPARKSRRRRGPRTGRNNSWNPGPGKRVRPISHGSGRLFGFHLHTEDERPCLCHTCRNSESPEKMWAVIQIATAGHVVCNDKQANNTECYFFYDTEEVDLNSCPKLSGAVIEIRDANCDTCHLNFISHDVGLFSLIEQILRSHFFSLNSIRQKYRSPALVEPQGCLLEQFEQLWQRFTRLGREYLPVVKQVIAIWKGDPELEFEKHRKGRRERLGDDYLGLLLLDRIRGGVQFQTWIETMEYYYEQCCEYLRKNTKLSVMLPNSERELAEGKKWWRWEWELWVKCMEKLEMVYKHFLDENAPMPPPAEFNEDHRLTVIVSHPHGCSKKISIGDVTERTIMHDGHNFNQFTYTTPTCPGSSGALVFVLGHMALHTLHPHSANRSGGSSGQLNESAFFL